jgi:hypothetical protein
VIVFHKVDVTPVSNSIQPPYRPVNPAHVVAKLLNAYGVGLSPSVNQSHVVIKRAPFDKPEMQNGMVTGVPFVKSMGSNCSEVHLPASKLHALPLRMQVKQLKDPVIGPVLVDRLLGLGYVTPIVTKTE